MILNQDHNSFKSGNKDFCIAVKNPEKPIATNGLNKKQKKMLDTLIKKRLEAHQIKIKPQCF